MAKDTQVVDNGEVETPLIDLDNSRSRDIVDTRSNDTTNDEIDDSVEETKDNEDEAVENTEKDIETTVENFNSLVTLLRDFPTGESQYSFESMVNIDSRFREITNQSILPVVISEEHFITKDMRYMRFNVAMEGVWDAIVSAGNKIKELIMKLFQGIKAAFDYFFDAVTIARRRIEKAKRIITQVPKSVDPGYLPYPSEKLARLCNWGGEDHTLIETVRTLSLFYGQVMSEFEVRLPKFLDHLNRNKIKIDNDIFKDDKTIKEWLGALQYALSPVFPNATRVDVSNDPAVQDIRTILEGEAQVNSTIMVESPIFPADFRIFSIVPQSILRVWESSTSTNILRFIGTPGYLARQGPQGYETYLNDLSNINFEFRQKLPPPELRIPPPDKSKMMGLNADGVRESITLIDSLITALEKDRNTVKKIQREAQNLVNEFNKLDYSKIDMRSTHYRTSTVFRVATLKAMNLINKPFKEILKWTGKVASFLSAVVTGEAQRMLAAKNKLERGV